METEQKSNHTFLIVFLVLLVLGLAIGGLVLFGIIGGKNYFTGKSTKTTDDPKTSTDCNSTEEGVTQCSDCPTGPDNLFTTPDFQKLEPLVQDIINNFNAGKDDLFDGFDAEKLLKMQGPDGTVTLEEVRANLEQYKHDAMFGAAFMIGSIIVGQNCATCKNSRGLDVCPFTNIPTLKAFKAKSIPQTNK